MQTFDSRMEGQVVEGADGGSMPAVLLRPLDLEHVVAEDAPEHDVVGVRLRVHLLLAAQLNVYVFRLHTKYE